jgi:glycogen(starch) synthase
MRILFWPGTFWPVIGGIEVHAAHLLPALQARGHEFVVITTHSSPDHPREAVYKNIPVYRLPFWEARGDVDRLIEIRQKISSIKREFAPELVHRNGIGIGDYFHLITANVSPAPLLVTLCNDLKREAIDQDTSLHGILRHADWVTGVSAAAVTQAQQLVPDIAEKSSVIYNGLDTPDDKPEPLPDDPPRLLCLGRLAPQKGFDLALSAFASVISRFPRARLVIAGDGPDQLALRQQAASLGIESSVEFLGWVLPEQVPGLINTATMVVMPSRWEGHPLVAVQASLMARPIVGTPVGGMLEVVLNEETGLLVEQGNPVALADGIMTLLADHDAASEMGQKARQRAQELFSWEACVDAYDSLYRDLHEKSSRHLSTSPGVPPGKPRGA